MSCDSSDSLTLIAWVHHLQAADRTPSMWQRELGPSCCWAISKRRHCLTPHQVWLLLRTPIFSLFPPGNNWEPIMWLVHFSPLISAHTRWYPPTEEFLLGEIQCPSMFKWINVFFSALFFFLSASVVMNHLTGAGQNTIALEGSGITDMPWN